MYMCIHIQHMHFKKNTNINETCRRGIHFSCHDTPKSSADPRQDQQKPQTTTIHHEGAHDKRVLPRTSWSWARPWSGGSG